MRSFRAVRGVAGLTVVGLVFVLVLSCRSPASDVSPASSEPASGVALAATATPPQKGVVAPELLALVDEAAQPRPSGGPFRSSNELLLLNAEGSAVAVRVTARDVDALLPALEALGFEVLGARPEQHFVEGFIPIERVPDLAGLREQGLLGVVAVSAPQSGRGAVTSQADFVQEAERVRNANPGYDGTGQRIGILSDSFDVNGGAAAGIASGDLPAAGVEVLLEGPAGSIDEGRAMAELVHDLAPGAEIAFASAFFGEAAFADSIRDLADPAQGNCLVITDDIFYFDEPLFQDGVIAQAIDEVVTTRNVTYFALAGNLANQSYESTAFAAAPDPSFGGQFHDFDPGPGVDTRQSITIPGGARIIITLQWDDPFYTTSGVDTDLDIALLLPGTGTVAAVAATNNITSQIPNERFAFTNTSPAPAQYELAIQLFAGSPPGIIKYVNYGRNSSPPITFNEYGTFSPTLIPHGAARNGRAVGAVNFFAQDIPADFSSWGPNTILFAPDGTPQTPEIRQNPDFAAIQGTDTTFFGSDFDGNGFPNFFGTSAAAPHAAAIAALLRQAEPGLTPNQVYTRLEETALDVGSPGFDIQSGHGLINAFDAIFGPSVPAPLNFSDDLESGSLALAWETNTTGAGRLRVTDANGPAGGISHVTMDSALNNTPSRNELVLRVNLAGKNNLTLSFDQREFGDEDDLMPETFSGSVNADGVALSVDGSNWYRLVSLTGSESTGSYQSFSFDLDQFAADNGLTLGADVRIKFQQFDNFAIDDDGFAFDNISLTALNSAPELVATNPPALAAIAEDVADGDNSGTPVADLIGGIVSDADGDALAGIALTLIDETFGTWQYRLAGAATWTDLSPPAAASALLLRDDAVLRFLPQEHFNGMIDPALQFRAWDQTSGSPGTVADTTSNGGNTAFSVAQVNATITVAAVNDPPIVQDSIADQLANIDQPFNYTFPATLFSDVDDGDALTFAARLSNGAALPAWLSFDPLTRTFSGTPASADARRLNIVITATDNAGASADTGFAIRFPAGIETTEVYLPLVVR